VTSARWNEAVAAIDAANADDPTTIVVDGIARPKELVHAQMMTRWVGVLDPEADEVQLIAARGHHLRRWELPRSDYPAGRAGYLRWRTEQGRRHAAGTAEIMRSVGYDDDAIERCTRIIRKQGLRDDPAVQVHEDALCLVFLETQFSPVAEKLGDDKTIDVLAKTIVKMSPAGLAAAAELDLDPHDARLLDAALAVAAASTGVAGEQQASD
jgi:hypothetical protein